MATKFRVDDLLTEYNKNKPAGKPALDRIAFGQLVFPDKTDGYINATLSKWNNPNETQVPSFMCARTIAKVLKMDMNKIQKFFE